MDGPTHWFVIVAFISSGFFAGLFIANCVYYNRIRTGGNVSSGEAKAMLWINIILAIVALIIFVWAVIKISTTGEQREKVKVKTKGYLNRKGDFYGKRSRASKVNETELKRRAPRSGTGGSGVNTEYGGTSLQESELSNE
jgi:hypothetical protein